MVTIKDIADKAQCAISTVSYALNNDPRIPEETKHKIINLARELGYKGKSGKKSGSGFLRQAVLCVNTISGVIYSELAAAMKNVLNVSNCELLIYAGKNVSRIKWMDGLFVLNSQVETHDIEEVVARKIPVVMMDRDVDVEDAANVTLDNFQGVYATTSAVIAKGARTFAFVSGPSTSFESRSRYEGFCKALSDNCLHSKNTIVLQSDFTYEGGINVSHYLSELQELPDAIVCANDETAMGIIEGIKTKKPFAKVMVTGFDGIAPKNHRGYITAKAERNHWGAIAAYAMLQSFDKVKAERKIKIPVELVEYF